jgi:lysophospholipase L1-like esterase
MRYGQLKIGMVFALALGPIACGSSAGTPPSGGAPGDGSSGSEVAVHSGAGTVPAGSSSSSSSGTSTGSSSGGSTPPGGGQPPPSSVASGSSSDASAGSLSNDGGGSSQSGDGGSGDGDTVGSGSTSGDSSAGGGDGGQLNQSALPAITIHMAGDSTMSDYTAATTQEGWGQEFGQYFISTVTIDNQAQPGANIQTFYAGKWKTLIANVKAGDYVMAAFGINDSGTTHGPVSVPDFTTEMGVMASEVAAKNATFIPTTSSPLQVWVNGVETNTRLQPYVDATIEFGMTKGLPVDDLNALGVAYYNMVGQTAAAALTFNGDKAHFDKAGATEMASLASQALAKANSPLAAYLR